MVVTGRAALKDGRWQAAADAFTGALTGEERAEALLGLGQALWWLGDMRGALSRLEEAYAAFSRRPDPPWAAGCALRIAFHQKAHLANPAAAEGWLARASRLIDAHALDFLHGERLLMQAYLAHDAVNAEAWARQAHERGRAAGDRDLELSALSQIGASLVEQGRVGEGLGLLGEAMAACLGGETDNLEIMVFANCSTIVACARCADFDRAAQWIRAGRQLAERHGIPYLDVECRAAYAAVQFATGRWREAEEMARATIALSEGHAPAYQAAGLATIALIRLAEGRVEEAARLVAGFDGSDACLPVVARLRLRQGQPALARAGVRQRLDIVGEARLEAMPLLELLGEADAADGDHAGTCRHARHLLAFGARADCRVATACGERLLGVGLAPALPDAARQAFDRAFAIFTALAMPYEAARTRYAAAAALGAAAREMAIVDAQAALDGFEALGAAGDADQAVALLRSLGEKAVRRGQKGLPLLTRREREVLALIGEGLSNPQIAERLFVSRKTVEHHVANVLAKLAVKTRAQAAAEAVRRLGTDRPENQPPNR